MTQLTHLGQSLKTLRKYRGLSRKELAKLCGTNLSGISAIEKGKSNFQVDTLVQIAEALDCTVDIYLKPSETEKL